MKIHAPSIRPLTFFALAAACAAAVAEEMTDALSVTNAVAVAAPAVNEAAVVMLPTNVLPFVSEMRNRRISTRTFHLVHASAEMVAERFNTMWSGDFGIAWKVSKIAQAFPEANVVMVTAPGVILDACAQAIQAIDVETPQVYIEARFVELQNSASHKLGIDWSMLDGMRGSSSFGGGMDLRNIGNAVQNFKREYTSGNDKITYDVAGATENRTRSVTRDTDADGKVTTSETSSSTSTYSGRDGGTTFFSGTLSFSDMYLILNAIDASGDARIFSNPKIIVASGKKATVDMTEKYPNVTISAKRTTSGSSDSLDLSMNMAEIPGEDKFMFAKESFFSWGISLEVTPRVSTNGLINVSIVPTISSRTDWVTSGAGDTTTSDNSAGTYSSRYPVLDVQRLVTDFALKNGTTAVIGGLSKTEETQTDNGIPWLRDIPWIGDKLFGSKIRQKVQKEILVFVTVGMADPKDLPQDVGLPKNAVLGRMYTERQKLEPGDRTGNAIEGIASLDLRSLEEQARDPLATNVVERTTFHLPFQKKPEK